MATFDRESVLVVYIDKDDERRVQVAADNPEMLNVLDAIESAGAKDWKIKSFGSFAPPTTEKLITIFNLLWTLDGVANDPNGPWRTIGEDLLAMDVGQ